MLDKGFFHEENNLLKSETLEQFKARWLFDCQDARAVMRQMREISGPNPNAFVQWLVRMQVAFFNADFRLTSSGELKKTESWLEARQLYPFEKLARDIWNEYILCANAVVFWRGEPSGPRNGPKPPPESRIDGLPLVTVFDTERVRYSNDFGTELVWITPARRKLTDDERDMLGKRYADAIEEGKELKLDQNKGEFFKVLTTAKKGSGFAMPRWKSIIFDLAILELLRVGDWNGAWARRKIVRHTSAGHEIRFGQLAGGPDFFAKKKFVQNWVKEVNKINGYSELATNFDQIIKYVFLEAGFFDVGIYAAVQERLDHFAGAIGMMMRKESNQMPYLMSMFRAEGFAERDIVGGFIRQIVNDPNFHGREAPPPAALLPQWDDTIFFNEKMLMAWLSFAYQNGFASPQTMRRYLRLMEKSENERMREAHARGEDYEPVFEPKQGLLGGAGGGENDVSQGGEGRPPKRER